MARQQDFLSRLNKFAGMKYKWNEMHKLIIDFIITPHLTDLIDNTNSVHTIKSYKNMDGNFKHLTLISDRQRRAGILNKFARFFSPRQEVMSICNNNQLFICSYYRHSYFSLADTLRQEYNEKLREIFGFDFVVLNKAG